MTEKDPLDSILRDWTPPSPSPQLDSRMLDAYRQATHISLWRRFLGARVTIPVPVLATLLLLAAAWFLTFRTGEPGPAVPQIRGYVTRIEAVGFEPLPNGEARIIPRPEVRQ